ncbi:hypothetical protein HGRIS_004060 [Hohenbuehelia grisea]|uniref:Uncharacterized protein n=1 Tax=Hohenbuehelia grisea TaxID=104357 RepID=A0ABR3JHU4_9AGAR
MQQSAPDHSSAADDFARLLGLLEHFGARKPKTTRRAKPSPSGSATNTTNSSHSLASDGTAHAIPSVLTDSRGTKNKNVAQGVEEDAHTTMSSAPSTKAFTLGRGKRYRFTFKLMIHKLYELEEWAKKVKDVLEGSQKQFRPLAEHGSATKAPLPPTTSVIHSATHGMASRAAPVPVLRGSKPSPLRARRHSTAASAHRNDATPPKTPVKTSFPTPRSLMALDANTTRNSSVRVVKKRCIGRRKSHSGISVSGQHPAGGTWVYDAAASSLDPVRDNFIKKRKGGDGGRACPGMSEVKRARERHLPSASNEEDHPKP